MAKTTLTFLGTFSGTSKKTGKEFNLGYFYRPAEKGRGFEALNLFLDPEVKKSLDSKKPLEPIDVDLRFVNGQNIIISVF